MDIVHEVQDADASEYSDVVKSQFSDRAPRLDTLTQQSNQNFLRFYPDAKLQTMKSNSGNFVVQWLENNAIVAIVGIITKKRRITQEDYPDLLEFFDMLLDRIRQGKTVMTSPNRKSIRLLDRIQSMAEKQGMRLNIKKDYVGNVAGGDISDPELDFHQITITKENM